MKNATWIPTGYCARFETKLGELNALVTRSGREAWWWEISSLGSVIESGGAHRNFRTAQRNAAAAVRRYRLREEVR